MSDTLKLLLKKSASDARALTVVSPDKPNVLQTMMHLEQANTRAKATNKVALEAAKEKRTVSCITPVLVWLGLCSDSHYTCVVDQDALQEGMAHTTRKYTD